MNEEKVLDGRVKKSNKENIAPIKICEKCFAVQPIRREKCIYCGHIFKITQRKRKIKREMKEI